MRRSGWSLLSELLVRVGVAVLIGFGASNLVDDSRAPWVFGCVVCIVLLTMWAIFRLSRE